MAHSKDKILEASLELFSARGYSAVTTKAIAEAAMVNEVTVFRLFGSKDRLFREVFAVFYIKPDEAIRSMRLRYELESDLIAFAETFFAFFSGNHKIVNMSIKDIKEEFDDIDDALRGQVDIMRAAVSPYLVSMVERGEAVGCPDELATLFVECLFGLAFHRIMLGGIEDLGPDAVSFARIFAKGVAPGGDDGQDKPSRAPTSSNSLMPSVGNRALMADTTSLRILAWSSSTYAINRKFSSGQVAVPSLRVPDPRPCTTGMTE